MRILFLSTGIFKIKYGQQRYDELFIYTCLKQLSYSNFRIILLHDSERTASIDFKNFNVKFTFCGGNNSFINKIKFILVSFWYTFIERPNIIICAHINLSVITWTICRIFKIRYIVLTHGLDVWNIKNRFKIKALKAAEKIVSVSSYTAQRIKEQIKQPIDKIFILPPFIDTQVFNPDRGTDGLSKRYNLEGWKVILTVARLDFADRNKGFEKAILSLPKVIKIIPEVKYLLVGKGDDIPRLKKLASNLGLQEHVNFVGFVAYDELCFYYNLSDLFIMPSTQEGFGIVFLEALACGKPVIAGNKDGSKDTLLNGKIGLLIDPNDVDGISELIINVLKGNINDNLKNGDFLRQSVIDNFGADCFSRRIKEMMSHIA